MQSKKLSVRVKIMIIVICCRNIYGYSDEILNDFHALEKWNWQLENYLEFCQTSHVPKTDHQNGYFTLSYKRFWLYLISIQHFTLDWTRLILFTKLQKKHRKYHHAEPCLWSKSLMCQTEQLVRSLIHRFDLSVSSVFSFKINFVQNSKKCFLDCRFLLLTSRLICPR